MKYREFADKYIGKRIIDASLGGDQKSNYQCVSLIKQYLRECYAIEPGAWGNAKDYWLSPNPELLKTFHRISGVQILEGDIVVLKPTPTNEYGHIAIANGDGTMLEQNGSTGGGTGTGPDAIRYRAIPYDRVYGVLRSEGVNEMIENIMPHWQKIGRLHRQVTGYELPKERFDKDFVGQTWEHGMDMISNNAQADQNTYDADIGRRALGPEDWPKQIRDWRALAEKLAARTDTPTAAQQQKIDGLIKQADELEAGLKSLKDSQ